MRIWLRGTAARTQQLAAAWALAALLLAGCQPVQAPATPAPPTATPVAPVRLEIPALGLDARVAPMAWQVVGEGDERTTEWVIAPDVVGWLPTSGDIGEPGNVVLAAHQSAGEALFAPLALGGAVPVGMAILVSGPDGQIYTYRVVEVSEPIPLVSGNPQDEVRAAAYAAETDTPTLTLITGWPDFTTTHRVFVRAELVPPGE